mgnify:CR=1 FL=1
MQQKDNYNGTAIDSSTVLTLGASASYIIIDT